MQGSIVLKNAAGRALRRKPGAVLMQDVLDCGGGFSAGDTVYITFRAVDGGQYAIGSGIVCFDASVLKKMLRAPESAAVIVREEDLRLLWP